MAEGFSPRTWLLLAILLVVVIVFAYVSRIFQGQDSACPRPYPTTELAALLAAENPDWPVETRPTRTEDLRPLADPDDSKACERIRALLPETLAIGMLAPQSAAFYQVDSIYVVPIVPNLKPEEIEAMERGEFGNERRGATFLFDAGYQPIGVVEN